MICSIQRAGTCTLCIMFSCYQVVLFTARVFKSRRWIIILNNVLLVDRQQWQNAVPSDEEWVCGHWLYTLMYGTVVTSDWGRGSITVLWAVAQCSLVQTNHDHRGAFYLHLLPLWRHRRFVLNVVLFYQTIRHNKPEDSNLQNIRFPSLMHIIHRRVLIKVCVMLHCGSCASELKLIVSSCLSLTWESA
jgi:hypothetical protein